MKQFIILFCIIGLGIMSHAQEQQVFYKTQDLRSYSQYSFYLGYDIPTSDPGFNYLKYKGDLNTGISFHNFWNWIGIQADISYTFTNADSDFNLPLIYYNDQFAQTSTLNSYYNYVDKMKKLFLGVGPAFKYQSKNNKFVADASVMGGLGAVQKGAIVQVGDDPNFSSENYRYGLAVNYHSGFERKNLFALKSNLRLNYFFQPDFGVFVSFYFMDYFNAKESDANNLLVDYNFQNVDDIYYYFYPIYSATDMPVNGVTDNLDGIDVVRSSSQNNRGTYDLSSFGINGGVSWKVNRTTKEIRCPSGYYLCPKDGLCYLDDNCGIVPVNNVKIIAKDKLSGQSLENVKVVLINDSDKSDLGEKMTDRNGQTVYSNVNNSDYEVDGTLGDVKLESATIKSDEFNDTGSIEKTIYFDNPNFIVSGKILDCNDNSILAATPLKAVNIATLEETLSTSDENGNYEILLPPANYVVEVIKDDYFSERKVMNLLELDRTKTAEANLDVCAQLLTCNSGVKFKNLLFKLNDYHIEAGSTEELDNLAEFLKVNPNVKLEISAYTDSRGSDAYNLRLSQQRAEETVKYLVGQGVQRNRLVAKGYGETDLLNQCSNGVECTEEEQAINRRTEFKVICEK